MNHLHMAEPPIILQDLKTFTRKMDEVWRDNAWWPAAGRYRLVDAVVDVQMYDTRYPWPRVTVTVVEYVTNYP